MLDTQTRPDTLAATAVVSRRAAGVAAVVGGALALAGDCYHLFVMDERSEQMSSAGYKLHGFALMAALILFMLAAPALARTRPVKLALPLALAGTALVVGDIWAEVVVLPGVTAPQPSLVDPDITDFHLQAVIAAFAVFAIGWLLYGVSALRGRWCAKPVAWLIVVGAVLAFLPIGGSYVLLSVGLALLGLSAVRAEP